LRCVKNNIPEGTEFEILEILHTNSIEEAGNREWWWAEKFGYLRGRHYKHATGYRNLTAEQRINAGHEGGTKARANETVEQRIAGAKRASDAAALIVTIDQKREWQLRGVAARLQNNNPVRLSEADREAKRQRRKQLNDEGRSGFLMLISCPHCGRVGTLAPLTRWHFDNCPKKSKSLGES
jgi:hypothetical protein